MRTATILTAASLLVLSACGDTGRTLARPITAPLEAIGVLEASPEWVRTPPRAAGMLYGIGQAERGDREGALARARQDLITQLEVSIDSTQEHNATGSTRLATTEARSEQFQEDTRSQVTARASAEDLPGVTVVKQEDGSRSTWVLISLDRRQWAEELAHKIQAIDGELRRALDAIAAIPDDAVPQRLSIAGRLSAWVLPRFAERDVQVGRLHLADPTATVPPEVVDRAAVNARLTALLKDLTVELALAPGLEDFAAPAFQAFARSGFKGLPPGAGASLQADLKLTLRSQSIAKQLRMDGRLSGTIRLAPAYGGAVLAAVDLNQRASATSEDVGRDRLVKKLADDLAKDLDQRLLRILAGEP